MQKGEFGMNQIISPKKGKEVWKKDLQTRPNIFHRRHKRIEQIQMPQL
jgi:hypothetical protein